MKCQWQGCTEDALPESCGRIRLMSGGYEIEVNLFFCDRHRAAVLRDAITGVSLTAEPKPARPA